MNTSRSVWWRGNKGEWYVVIQFVIFLAIILGPRSLPELPAWPAGLNSLAESAGVLLMALGGLVSLLSVFHLGANLTPLPHPKVGATLVVTGMYRFVRHPIYFGVILMAVGFALLVQGSVTLIEAVVLALFFDIKSQREELWLVEHFASYADYQKRVRKLIPFLY